MNLRKINSFFEKFWLVVAIGTTIYGLYYIFTHGWSGNEKYAFLPVLAFFLFYLRRRMRVKLEAREQEEQTSTGS